MAAALIVLNALVSAAFAIAGLASDLPADARSFAMYAAARAVPLAIVTVVLVARRSTTALVPLGAALAAIQACDAVVGIASHDLGKTLGPAVLAALTLVAVVRLRAQCATLGACERCGRCGPR